MNKVVSLNRGLSQSEDSSEQIVLDKIFNFKFTDCNVKATNYDHFMEERNGQKLAATSHLCTLA